jgi:hypothetical protein
VQLWLKRAEYREKTEALQAEERTNRYRREKDGAAMADWPDTAVDIPGSAASIRANENWNSSSASQSNDIYLIIAGNMQAAEPPCGD